MVDETSIKLAPNISATLAEISNIISQSIFRPKLPLSADRRFARQNAARSTNGRNNGLRRSIVCGGPTAVMGRFIFWITNSEYHAW